MIRTNSSVNVYLQTQQTSPISVPILKQNFRFPISKSQSFLTMCVTCGVRSILGRFFTEPRSPTHTILYHCSVLPPSSIRYGESGQRGSGAISGALGTGLGKCEGLRVNSQGRHSMNPAPSHIHCCHLLPSRTY